MSFDAELKDIAEILRAVASLLWPIFAFVAVLLFREPLKAILARLKKGKAFGAEIELEEIQSLSEKTAKLESGSSETKSAPTAPVTLVEGTAPSSAPDQPINGLQEAANVTLSPSDEFETVNIAQVLETALHSPSLAIIALAAGMENRVRYLMAVVGIWSEHKPSFLANIDNLAQRKYVKPELSSAAKEFWRFRNRVVHGMTVSDEALTSAVGLGVSIYRALLDVPHPNVTVSAADIVLYADSTCTLPVQGSSGVMLQMAASAGTARHVYPTTKVGYYEPKMKVSWEWNMDVILKETWYRDPFSNEIKLAFSSSANFVGRDLRELV